MVTTRSASRKNAGAQRQSEGRRSSGSSSASTSSSPKAGKAASSTPSGTLADPTPARKNIIMLDDGDTPPRSTRASASLRLLAVPGAVPGENLGRGFRQHREVVTLDEQYLSQSMRSPPSGRGSGGGPHGRLGATGHGLRPEQFVIHQRFPARDAAKRALSSLQDTLQEMRRSGNTSSEDDDDQSASSSSSSDAPAQLRGGGFRFRHHPELADPNYRLKNQDQRASSSSSSSSSSEEEEKSKADGTKQANRQAASSTWRGRTSGASADSGNKGQKRARSSSSVSAASISDDSVREESIEKLAQQDAKLVHDEDGSDDGVSDQDEMVTQAELRRATRNAKESVEKNININYYMADAVGSAGPDKKVRKRELDRRYRHLFEAAHGGEDGALGHGGDDETGLGGGGSGAVPGDASASAAGALGDISPLHIDDGITFDSVGGLPEHIVTLREMVLLPLLYPDLLRQLNLSPPRGVLFVGPPGTGKTLMARALANEGSRFTGQKITFFMRKGADILSKWVGESERQLKLLFEEAKRQQPSIIFFDEIDGLAPTRHTKTEQTQAALVATLLALLDGMEDRGQVVVIGATNRPDTLDPALRRPGRFDRELLFPSPDAAARRHILGILTQTLLPPTHARRGEILTSLVAHTEGYSGADLKAVCTEAGLNRLRSAFPQLYTTSKRLRLPLLSPSASAGASASASVVAPTLADLLEVRREDFFSAVQRVQPSLRRGGAEVRSLASLEEHQEVLYRDLRDALLRQMGDAWPAVGRALRREQRDCTNLVAAVRELSAFPVPYPRGPLLVFLTSEVDVAALPVAAVPRADAIAQATLLHAALALVKGLPSFQPLIVHLPHIQVSFLELPFGGASGGGGGGGGAGGSAALFSDVFASGHMYELVQVVQRSSPCAVVLRGAAEWLHTHGLPLGAVRASGEEGPESALVFDPDVYDARLGRMKALRYYLNLLAETEVLLIVPCEDPRTRQALLGQGEMPPSPQLTAAPTAATSSSALSSSSRQAKNRRSTSPVVAPATRSPSAASEAPLSLHPCFTLLDVQVPCHPEMHAVTQFVHHLYHVVSLSLVVSLRVSRTSGRATSDAKAAAEAGEAEEDTAPLPALPVSRAQQLARHQRELALWRRVEYRRLQLRHVLLKWVSQYVSAGKYKLLLSPDLDLTPAHELYKAWQRHTKGRRIGLQDVVEKLENESYTCLSQYHDDVDRITRNVRTFFTSRSAQDQRYRLKALELKETTVLSLYRINRGVVRFCETYKDVKEPAPVALSDSTGEGLDESPGSVGATSASQGQKDPLSFSQRPASARAKKPPPRYFGQRRRRRRPAPKAVAAHNEETDEEAEEADQKSGRSDAHARSASDENVHTLDNEENNDAETETDDDDGSRTSPFSPTQAPAETLVRWAASQLRGLPYHVLLEVFRYMMMALEVQIHVLQQQPPPPSDLQAANTADDGTHTTPARPPSSHAARALDGRLSTFTPLAPPPHLADIRRGRRDRDNEEEEEQEGEARTHAHASPAAREPVRPSTPSRPERDTPQDRHAAARSTPTRTSSSRSSVALVASRTPSSHGKSPLSTARVAPLAVVPVAVPLVPSFESDTEQSEKAYVLQFFKRSLLAAVEDCRGQ